MRYTNFPLLDVLLLANVALDQFTTVTGTVTDPNDLPYANGIIVSVLLTSATPRFTARNLPYTPPTQLVGLDGSGKFAMQLANNTALTPGGTTWTFTLCSGTGTVFPYFGKGPVCFVVAGVTISGSSQDIGATLRAAALALTASLPGTGTVTGSSTLNTIPLWTPSGTALGNSNLTQTIGGRVQANTGNGLEILDPGGNQAELVVQAIPTSSQLVQMPNGQRVLIADGLLWRTTPVGSAVTSFSIDHYLVSSVVAFRLNDMRSGENSRGNFRVVERGCWYLFFLAAKESDTVYFHVVPDRI